MNEIIITKEMISLRKRAILFYVLAVISGLFAVGSMSAHQIALLLILGVVALGLLIAGSVQQNKYKVLVKNTNLTKIFEAHFDDVTYQADKGYDRELIRSLEIVDLGNIYNSNDLLSGSYQGIKFQLADVHTQRRVRSGKTTTTITLFKGRILVYDFTKNFTCYLQIRSNAKKIFGKNSKPYSFFSEHSDSVKIEFESTKFNEDFLCYGNNELEARYIVTPHFMEKLDTFVNTQNCSVVFGFMNSQLYIALDTRQDAFEPGFLSIVDKSFLDDAEKDLKIIKEIIDELDLDRVMK